MNPVKSVYKNPEIYAKAIYAFFWTLLTSLVLVIEDGVTATEGLALAIAVLGATGGVYGLKNAPNPIDQPGRVDDI